MGLIGINEPHGRVVSRFGVRSKRERESGYRSACGAKNVI